jgi:predicted nuclease of restriction endonuclease-like RecB superfamily
MLRADLIKPRLSASNGRIQPQQLPANYHYLHIAGELTHLFQQYIGRSRGDLHDALRDYEGDSLDYMVIRGLAAVLEARCTFGNEPAVDPVELRAALFGQGPVTKKHDLFGSKSREGVIGETAVHYHLPPSEIENALFADLAEEQILLDTGDAVAPGALIGRYNLEVARGLLYWAREVRIEVHGGYKDLFKYIKLFKLMHTITPLPTSGYQITLHGPLSPFVKSTIRYGLQFAKFMPALLLGQNWQMHADVRPPGAEQVLLYTLDDQTELRTHFKGSGAFDSAIEADFAAEFEAKYSRGQRTWELAREDELIDLGDTVMIPDFSFTHGQDGRRAFLEIIGFWHPNYLRRKLEKVQQAKRHNLILLVYESANVSAEPFEEVSAGEVIRFKNKPVLKDVITAVERCATI